MTVVEKIAHRKPVLVAILLSAFAALGGEGPAGACTWSVKGDGEVVCTVEGVAFRAPPSLPVKVVSAEAGRIELELMTRDGPVKAVWARAADGALECVLSAPPGRAMSAPLAYPAGWTTREGDDLVLPFGEGVAYPVCDPEVAFTGSRFRLSHGMEASMGFFGIARAGVWAMTGVEDTLCGEIVCHTNAPYSAGVAWRAYDGGRWGRDRRVRFFFARSIGEAAGKYRAWREAQGRVRTLAEKAKKNPHIASFPGTADFWLWDDNDQNRLYNWPLVEEFPPLDVKRIAAEMKSLGMDRVLVNVFNGLSREDAAFLSRQGYLAGTYDCLRDMFHPGLLQVANPSNFVRAARFLPIAGDVARINPDGKPARAWSIPDREGKMHPMQALCDAMAPEMCRRFIAPEVAEVGYTSRLMDVQACGGPAACFSKTHPCTRGEALASLRAEHRYLADDLALVIGVEVGNENLLDSYHYAEGLPSLPHQFRKELCWRYKDQALYGDEIPRRTRTLMHNPKYRIPLWELVYHDCAVNYYYWADTTFMYPQLAPLKDLFCRLYGIPPIYSMNVSTWDRLKKDVAASYARASEVARETMFSRMTSFEWLTPDRLVQRTTFANGRSVTVDFREQYARAIAAAPGGFKVMSYNVRHCEGMDRQLDLARIAAVVNRARPRFAALQELDCKTKRSKRIDEPQELGRLTGMFPTFAKTIDFQGGGYGVMLLSREKPLSVEKIPLPGAEPRVLLLAEFDDCFVGCTHLSVSAAKERADSVALIEKAVKGRTKPVFVAGDWNSLPDSSVLAGLSRFLRVLSPTDGRTYHGRPANGPSGTTTDFCIDYIAVDSVYAPQFTVVDSGVVADRVSSDHAPIFVTLVPEQK